MKTEIYLRLHEVFYLCYIAFVAIKSIECVAFCTVSALFNQQHQLLRVER